MKPIQEDLVDRGLANAIFVFEGPDRPNWFHSMDAMVLWEPIPSRNFRRQWLLTIEYLAGSARLPQRFVLGLEGGRLTSGPSEEELLEMLEATPERVTPRGIPRKVTRFLHATAHETAGVAD